jgi:transposase
MDFEIRKDKTGRGRRLAREREACFQLMCQSYSSREACRSVGINIRTGKRWRNGWHSPPNGRKPAPPIHVEVPASGPSRYLREEDRIHIADRLREKASVRTIAAELGRSPSTVSREIRRNGMPLRADASRWAYRPHAAHRRAEQRRPRPRPGRSARARNYLSGGLTLATYLPMTRRLKKHLSSLPLADPSHRSMDGEVVDGEVVEDHGPFTAAHSEQYGADATAIKLEEPQS